MPDTTTAASEMPMKKIAVIDPFVVSPSIPCFNRLVSVLEARLTYHHPQTPEGLAHLAATSADAYVVLGSASNVTEPLQWHAPLADFLVTQLQAQKPIAGLCFGHQLLTHAFGAEVNYLTAAQTKLKGERRVRLTKPLWGLPANQEFSLAVSHCQKVLSLPSDLEAVGEGLSFDLVRHKKLPFFGSQPHLEASVDFCHRLAELTDSESIERVQQDGLTLLKAFFHHHGIIASIA